MANVLIVDDEREIGNFLSYLISDKGHQTITCTSGAEFDLRISEQEYQLAFLDVRLPDRNGLEILQNLKKLQPMCKAIVMTGYANVKTAVEAIKLGANDFIEKPFDDIEEIETLVDHLLQNNPAPALNHARELASKMECFIGKNKSMNQLFTLAYKFAQKNINVLIEGETGTGKDVLANFIHQASRRAGFPYVAVNCGAITESLLESELFGHAKGSFTGAAKDRKGYFELAGKGTLFLDEIGEASLTTQIKLLRVLETGEFIKVGGETIQRSQARVIAASHVNLQEAVANGSFREDLLYRLDVVKLTIPPLRERLEDIPSFIDFYLNQLDLDVTFAPETVKCLSQYEWPGNVRELVNVINRAVALAEGETEIITPRYLPAKFLSSPSFPVKDNCLPNEDSAADFDTYLKNWHEVILEMWKTDSDVQLPELLDKIKELETITAQAFIQKALVKNVGNRKEATKDLGISMRKLRYYLNEKKTSRENEAVKKN
ncbi:transcriptional regulator [Mesobacillus persicus]|uniref:Transcriptional regulator n=1 Tax=Mesobacillus persicus TaxID=930146 RepID=A0A1H7WM58_9BACI|nr:sigma-54 dependent transcriptional regulator [Mesobacillus persicus]SEM22139.1 transcriptional regulator [Mesobacillus persicus]